jgi:hypothetical protein
MSNDANPALNVAQNRSKRPRHARVGDRVRIERDEICYPSKGTWTQFRGRTGTVVEVNLGEYGVVFGEVRKPRSNGSIAMADAVWFQPHEIRALASESAVERLQSVEAVWA